MFDFGAVEGFEWDESNLRKVNDRHGVAAQEAEQVFASRVLVAEDIKHSTPTEPRWLAYGTTLAGRTLTVVFTVRGNRLRVISARPMSRKERRIYEAQT